MTLTPARCRQLWLAGAVTGALVSLLWLGVDLPATNPWLAGVVLALFAFNAFWLAGAAITALMGRGGVPASPSPRAAPARARTAVLWLVCGEDPDPIAARIAVFRRGLRRAGLQGVCDIFILSDTASPQARAAEARVFAPLGVRYRNRAEPEGRKPGNLQDWIAAHGADYDSMLVLDADSGFSAERLAGLRARMAAEPDLGLIQCAIRLRPGQSRLAGMQRLSARLCGAGFAHGLARLSGDAGNYWGHNALIRTRAFAEVTPLPALPGRAPMGGVILSHDFIEAAALRRAGWKVVIDPEARGSFEDSPESVQAHHRRDRRWAQGNLQHLRLIGARGLHPASRLHLLAGIQSYLSAPIWLMLVVMLGSGAVHATWAALAPLGATLALLMVPKLAGLARWRQGRMTPSRRATLRRALWGELAQTTLFAPLAMIRRTGFVLAVAAGRDSGWQPAGSAASATAAPGRPEAIAGGVIALAVTAPQMMLGGGAGAALLAATVVVPVVGPLLAAPWLIRWFDAPRPGTNAVAAYYDASTRRFLAIGGSGAALAIHRPLWAEGLAGVEAASAHVNTLVATAAEAALGRLPAQVCDLGCGVGGTLLHLARRWPGAHLTGVTLSAEQVRLARGFARARGLERQVQVVQSDFTCPPLLPRADLVIAIESHVHTDSAAGFLRAARAHLRPGGVLIIVDDMLATDPERLDPRGQGLVAAFCRGWRLGHVSPAAGLIAEARAQAFDPVEQRDLSPLLRLDRWRDRALRLAGPLADALGLGRVPLFANMIGGNALTQAHRAGIMGYRMVVLRDAVARRATPSPQPGRSAA